MMEARRHHIDLPNLRVHYHEQGEGRPLILLHGGLATAEMSWTKAMPRLANNYRVLAPDTRGHGATDNPKGSLSYPQFAEDVAHFIEALGLERPILIGYSDGAQTGIEFGIRHPAKTGALVLGGVTTEPTASYLEGLLSWGFTAPGRVDLSVLEREFGPFFESIKSEHAAVYGPDYWRSFLEQISELWLTLPRYDDAQLAGISAPALIAVGDRDEMAGLDQALRLLKLLPKAELAVIPGAGHGAGERELFWDAVEDFLMRQG